MRITFLLYNRFLLTLVVFLFLLNSFMAVDSLAQEMPLVYSVENTGADFPIPYLPSFNELPAVKPLPDPFEWADGRDRIQNFSDWECRRNEIGAQIQNYEIGEKPPRPDSITASYSDSVLTVNVTVDGRTLTLMSNIVLPAGTGPFPAVIGMNTPVNFILPSSILDSNKIAQVIFNADQVTTYANLFTGSNPSNSDPYFQLYPNFNLSNMGQYSAWAWGVSRIIDGLELLQNALPIDLKHIAVAGCSYAGKMALFAGAFDERIALTIALESGGGGATSWRYSHRVLADTVEDINNTDYNWFMNSMKQFSGDNVYRLPEDHHELMAMIAPRALYVTANPSYSWLANPSCYVCSEACKKVYDALGISDRFGFSIVGGHSHCQVPNSQIPEIEAFVDKFLLGKDTTNTNNISDTPYSIDLSQWITWTNPNLSNGVSFFGKTSLIYPSNLQKDLDKSVTFKWNKVMDADKYFIQLSTDPTFKTITKTDSTTDTLKTISGLLDGKRYYWRVQTESSIGLGPLSDVRNFVTYTPLPAMPQLVSVTPYPNRADYVTFKWNKVKNADKYLIQLSHSASFSAVLYSDSTSDTSKIVSGISEGSKYFWRVQAKNIEGPGSWSDSNFTIILAPTNLVLQISGINEIKLTWKDNSNVEDGYVIERKQNPDTTFSVLDTLKGSAAEFLDKNVKPAQTYTYRIKAYKDSAVSGYSNEAALTLVGVNEEEKIPKEYSISQNYPNPFNPTTKIKFGLPRTGLTKITVYDLLGREIRILINKELEAGYHEINIDAHNLPSGVYLYRIQSGDFIQTKKMILMK